MSVGISLPGVDTFPVPADSMPRQSDLIVYPTVNKGSFALQVNNTKGSYFDLRIIDEKGRIVAIQRLAGSKGIQTLQINLRNPSPGIYTIQAIGRSDIATTKMIVKF